MTTAKQGLKGGAFVSSSGFRGFGRRLADGVSYLLACFEVARQRRQLLALTDSELKDIGISRADSQREARRDFWDIPAHMKSRH